jgi:broad specificity phosphatase PhoE
VTRLVLCRHADPGAPDAPAELAQILRQVPFAAVYTSPLERAVATARSIAEGRNLTPVLVDDLREIDLGAVDGLAFEEYPSELQEALLRSPATAAFPGGESFADVRARVVPAVDAIVARHKCASVAVVAHAGPIRALLAHWLGIEGNGVFPSTSASRP